MPLKSPVRFSYLDEHAGSLDSAGRRLAVAEDDHVPIRERLRVLADVGRFVDEFFQLAGAQLRTGQGRHGIRPQVQRLIARQADALQRLRERLGDVGVELCDWGQLDEEDRDSASHLFTHRILPVLAPLSCEPGAAPPANLSLNLAVGVHDSEGQRCLRAVELPPGVPRFVRVRSQPGGTGVRVVPVEQVVAAHLPSLFPDDQIDSCVAFRVTRAAGLVPGAEGTDLLHSVERQLRLERYGAAVRLEVESHTPDDTLGRLLEHLALGREEVYPVHTLMGLADLVTLPVPGGAQPAVPQPAVPARFRPAGRRPADVLGAVDAGDVLVHFPYESYADTVVALLDQASADPALLAIKQTLYRASPDGPTVRALVRAAERGAHVVAVVELTARLDERNSVACAKALDRAGAHVVYGLVGLRTHCPLTLVIRDAGHRVGPSRGTPPGPRGYGVVGTGLHHPTRRPEGMSLLTADAEVTADLSDLFNYFTGYSRPNGFRKLLVGPGRLKSRLLELIRRETAAGPAGRIALKVYRLVDREVVDALYRAAQQGVRVDIVVSGACALRPGVPALSDGIRVVATAAQHFETSRLFAFGPGQTGDWFLSSGDLALARLDRQIDVAVPVVDIDHRARLEATLSAHLRLPAWEMDADGTWHRRGPGLDEALRRLAEPTGTSSAEGR
jgi:polyphosphate kinase